jgi:hypothetical protein
MGTQRSQFVLNRDSFAKLRGNLQRGFRHSSGFTGYTRPSRQTSRHTNKLTRCQCADWTSVRAKPMTQSTCRSQHVPFAARVVRSTCRSQHVSFTARVLSCLMMRTRLGSGDNHYPLRHSTSIVRRSGPTKPNKQTKVCVAYWANHSNSWWGRAHLRRNR